MLSADLAQRFPAATSIAGLERQYDRLERLLALPAEELFQPVPAASGWSPAEHLFHLSFANEFSFKNVLALVAEEGLLIRPLRSRPPEGEEFLRRGRLPRGVEAPRFVRPPRQLDPATLASFVTASRALLTTAAERADAIDRAPRGIPHQVLGDLEAPLWLRFARVHTAHHLGIVREIRRARR